MIWGFLDAIHGRFCRPCLEKDSRLRILAVKSVLLFLEIKIIFLYEKCKVKLFSGNKNEVDQLHM